MPSRTRRKSETLASWNQLAERRLRGFLKQAEGLASAKRCGAPLPPWQADVRLLSAPAMLQLNRQYKGKAYATDVLSFPAPKVFRAAGRLGEILICLPVLKRQALEEGHSPKRELDVLLVHGLLHLLGLDHERGVAEAKKMARLEKRLLARAGLISRATR